MVNAPQGAAKYRRFDSWYKIPEDFQRTWPSKKLEQPPQWCTVDLRDGNQALVNPMDHEKKLLMFNHLVKLGYKQIEVGFPSASQTDFDFIRYIIENGLVPDDVWIQVLTQAREHLIERTIESLQGAKKVILHLYNSTSELQRRVVFKWSRDKIKGMAVDGAKLLRSLSDQKLAQSAEVRLEYSPESFTGTELDFALEVCEAVLEAWGPTQHPVIFNCPATVEMATPNVYADQIEWMSKSFKDRSKVCLSVHPHNDRGTAVAAAELALMAGADRVEGCLFGSGERTGNVCLITLAMNYYSQGIDPGIDVSDLQTTVQISEKCTELKVPERYPWVGNLVYAAFSGSHQDAIKKGLAALNGKPAQERIWEVPYLPIDPADIGRSYEAIIRVNSQSGKAGAAFVIQQQLGLELPYNMQIEFSKSVQVATDTSKVEMVAEDLCSLFQEVYCQKSPELKPATYNVHTAPAVALAIAEKFDQDVLLPPGLEQELGGLIENDEKAWENFAELFLAKSEVVTSYRVTERDGKVSLSASVQVPELVSVESEGNGPIDALVHGLSRQLEKTLDVVFYEQQAISSGSSAEAVCFVQISCGDRKAFGCSRHENTTTASLLATVQGVRRVLGEEDVTERKEYSLASRLALVVDEQGKMVRTWGVGDNVAKACASALRRWAEDLEVLPGVAVHKRAEEEEVVYVQCKAAAGRRYGVGVDRSSTTASIKAVFSALNGIRAHANGKRPAAAANGAPEAKKSKQ